MTELTKLRVQLSLSIPPDHLKLAIPSRELDRAMLTICMSLVRAGATVAYGGDLRPEGFTFKIFRHLARAYADQGNVPFTHILSHPSLVRMNYDSLVQALKERRGTCETYVSAEAKLIPIRLGDDEVIAGKRGDAVAMRGDRDLTAWATGLTTKNIAEASTQAREAMATFVDASVLIGGKMGLLDIQGDQYMGAMPGIIEEALLMLRAGKPAVPLGAYGGATRDLAISLGLMEEGRRVPRGSQAPSYDKAISQAASLRNMIPADLTEKLSAIAQDDRAELIGREIVEVIARWCKIQPY